MGQIYSGENGIEKDLYKTKWKWDRFIMDRVALGQIVSQILFYPM